MKKAFGIAGTVFAVIVTAAALFYKVFWNDKVDFEVKTLSFPLSAEQKLEDFEYLYKTLEDSFPYFETKKRQYGTDWLSMKEEFREVIAGTRNDAEFYEELGRILMLLQNGHTYIVDPWIAEEYARLYGGHTPWSQVYGDSRVREAYSYWKSVLSDCEDMLIPVSFRYIEGEYYARGNPADPEGSPEDSGIPSGSRLLEIDGLSPDEYVWGLMESRMLKYDRLRKKAKVNTLVIYSESPVGMVLETPSGELLEITLDPVIPKDADEEDYEIPEHLFSTYKFEEDSIAYLRLPSFSYFYVEKDGAGIRAFLEEVKDYRSIIIDIRGNGGGSTNYWDKKIVPLLTDKPLEMRCYVLFRDSSYLEPFLKNKLVFSYLGLRDIKGLNAVAYTPEYYFPDGSGRCMEIVYKVVPDRPVGFNGKIYLLVDDYVYSASESFAAFAKATGWATLVGTDTGGDGIGFDPIPLVLPNSGLIVMFPGEMGLNPDGSVNEEVKTVPDVFVEQSYEDFMTQLGSKTNSGDLYGVMEYDTILRKAYELAKSSD